MMTLPLRFQSYAFFFFTALLQTILNSFYTFGQFPGHNWHACTARGFTLVCVRVADAIIYCSILKSKKPKLTFHCIQAIAHFLAYGYFIQFRIASIHTFGRLFHFPIRWYPLTTSCMLNIHHI